MRIEAVAEADKWNYRDLLLLADEQIDRIERYLYRGEMFCLWDGVVKTVCVVTDEGSGIYELKNLATAPEAQRQGYGGAMVRFVIEHCRRRGICLYVGTGENADTLRFYEGCGFVPSHIVRDFFTRHYDHPIVENGILLRDMIYLKIVFRKPV